MDDEFGEPIAPAERSRTFQSAAPVTASLPFRQRLRLFIKTLFDILLPKADETLHSSAYIAWFKKKTADYDRDSWNRVVKNSKARREAQYENTQPLIIAGRRVHKYMIIVVVILFLLVATLFRLLLLLASIGL